MAAVPGCTRGGGPDGKSPFAVPFVPVDPASASATDKEIARQQQRLRSEPGNANSRLALAQAFLQKAREVGDPTYYAKAASLLDDLARTRKDDPTVLVTQGTLALARHDFEEALKLGRRAVRLAPGNAGALGVVVDASNELGRYEEALGATEQMVDARPNLASLSRVSYARELRGDLDGAITAMTQAAAAGSGGSANSSGENLAYVQVLLGNLLLTRGDLSGAEASYAAAEQSFPRFALAKAGRARVLVTRGDAGGAASLLAEVVRVLPSAEHAIAHGDALGEAGRGGEAKEAYELVEAIARLYEANGVNVDLELALFEADHRPGRKAVERARRAVDERPSIQAHDALAWSLYAADDLDEAWRESRGAVGLGTRDPLVNFHAAAIAFGRGDRDNARRHLQVVLDTNPRFSALHAPKVAELATALALSPSAGR